MNPHSVAGRLAVAERWPDTIPARSDWWNGIASHLIRGPNFEGYL